MTSLATNTGLRVWVIESTPASYVSGSETDEQLKDMAWQMFCNAHPVEAYEHNPDGFWKYFHDRAPDITRKQMVALLKECEEPDL